MSERNAKIVAVFGGSRTPSDSEEYAEAYIVGKLLAQRGAIEIKIIILKFKLRRHAPKFFHERHKRHDERRRLIAPLDFVIVERAKA